VLIITFKYDVESFNWANSDENLNSDLKFTFLDALLDKSTALLAAEHDAVCIFVNDICDEAVLQKLGVLGVVCPSFK
jgi:D-lactate dehydrogenase